MNETSELETINEQTFQAEAKNSIGNKTWDQFLEEVLADEFIIRRSNPAVANQSRKEMIDWIAERTSPKRTLGPVQTLCSGSLGVVTGPISMNDENGKVHRYQNIKIFNRVPQGSWKCIYWQVSEMPA